MNRPLLVRLKREMEMMRGRRMNARTLAEALEVSRKTVYRDIDFLRDELGVAIEWNVLYEYYEVKSKQRILLSL